MKLNPTATRRYTRRWCALSRGNEALLHPFVDSKGNFGKVYSRDMAYAAPRYTEVKLDPICAELFRDIDSDMVDFVDNYDGIDERAGAAAVNVPNILVSPNLGIAVGMASNICSFNLGEVCQTAIEFIKDPDADIISTLPAPIFPPAASLSTTARR